jgi:uncharacterized DUF497 family protein
MEFEWNSDKDALNVKKHGVSFDVAQRVFDDENRIESIDDVVPYGEERSITTGLAGKALLSVVYTLRRERVRIISARKATKREKQNYYLQIGT